MTELVRKEYNQTLATDVYPHNLKRLASAKPLPERFRRSRLVLGIMVITFCLIVPHGYAQTPPTTTPNTPPVQSPPQSKPQVRYLNQVTGSDGKVYHLGDACIRKSDSKPGVTKRDACGRWYCSLPNVKDIIELRPNLAVEFGCIWQLVENTCRCVRMSSMPAK